MADAVRELSYDAPPVAPLRGQQGTGKLRLKPQQGQQLQLLTGYLAPQHVLLLAVMVTEVAGAQHAAQQPQPFTA